MKESLQLAEQQIFGWNESQRGIDIISLIKGMGLTCNEWRRLINNGEVDYMSLENIKIINHHFGLDSKMNRN